jgi:RNA polymerase sigma factor (sigma-70 family)
MAKDPWRDEQRLIQGLRAQDPLSLEALIQQHARELFYVARLILAEVGSEQDVEECLNDLFLIAWKEVGTFDPARGSLRSWLRMRTRYIALNYRRYLLRRQFPTGSITTSSEVSPLVQDHHPLDSLEPRQAVPSQLTTVGVDVLIEQQERLAELRSALEHLPAIDRFLIDLRYFQCASLQEMAARTNSTKHAIEARLSRARKVLRAALQEGTGGISIKRASLRDGRSATPLRREGLLA